MAIAVLPEEPKSRRDRLINAVLSVAILAILALFVYSMLDSYVF